MVTEATAYVFVLAGLATGLLCGFVLGTIWAWRKEDQDYRERRRERGLPY